MPQKLAETLKTPHNILFLTGAGVSMDSGIPDFESTDKTWNYKLPRIEVMSRPYFNQNPQNFWKIYRETFFQKLDAEPNNFHHFIASLEKDHNVTVATQNVDGLHTKAGSTNVIELHGNMNQAICTRQSCSTIYNMKEINNEALPRCKKCRKTLKPDISLFFEGINGYSDSQYALLDADLFIVAGTSLQVGPVNELPYFAQRGTPTETFWINKNPAPEDYKNIFQHQIITTMNNFIEELAKF